ncbi:HlyIII-domain-containing protein [Heliocybe sulcata]|uniref:HlyIII-domain-containing protein n=1 Tax=Heliocybe sulcata TaxID=5364 RepID=A0A5C3MUU3_9AGAM|nr:HlyIII-domain-containing protein [Heliocybe sulcata]
MAEPSGRLVRRARQDATAPEARSAEATSWTVSWKEIEPWQRDNEYILTGYRRALRSYRGCLASVFGYLHNETVNIHSHLIGAALFVYILCTRDSAHTTTTWRDDAVFTISLSSAIFCLLGSAGMHTFSCHSEPVRLSSYVPGIVSPRPPQVCARGHALDYTGIVVLIVGSFFPCIYYGFYCEPRLQWLYLSIISISGIGAAWIVLDPEYSRPTHRGARTRVFIALGVSAVLPVSHAVLSHGPSKLLYEMGFGWLILSGALYIAGALLYANRIPERYAPGKFDVWFSSHQIFHVHVVVAALAHYACVLTAFEHWHSKQGRCY